MSAPVAVSTNPMEQLKERFITRTAKVGIIGMGYVGYPMALLAASAGFPVTGIDVDENRVAAINRGESYIQDVPPDEAKRLHEAGLLRATTEYGAIADLDVVLITVPTPLNKTGDPDMTHVIDAREEVRPHLHAGMLIVLESTTYPGTTEELFLPIIEESGLRLGTDICVAFSPERIDPGNPTWGPRNTPKVVGGVTPEGSEVAALFYEQIVERVVPVSSSSAAEMVKLYENTFRAINIALVNELAIICHLLQVDVWEIVEAAGTKPFGFMAFYPGPGLGGHCIPVDPGYLAWKMRSLEYKTRFIDLATEVNTQMPAWVATRAAELLNEEAKPIKGSKILLLGMAYKNDIDDLRESPALDLFELLRRRGAEVCFHDPYCPTVKFDHAVVQSREMTPELLAEQDLVIITTGHKKRVDYHAVLQHASLVFDTRNITRNLLEDTTRARVVFL